MDEFISYVLKKLKRPHMCLVVENMADNTTKSTTDGWGPPSTWREKFAKRDYDEHVARYKLKEYQGMPLPRRRTATEILEDAFAISLRLKY
jgi:hypothetical protein